ncbi:hypothetical protein ACHAQH_002217 [Verticillium albo-atrum]
MVDFTNPTYEKLTPWNQTARRQYISACLCFPFDNLTPRSDVIEHLQAAISRLETKQPILASEIHLYKQSGTLYLAYEPPNCFENKTTGVTVEERPVDDLGDNFPRSYQELRDTQWPPGLFMNKSHIYDWDSLNTLARAMALRLQVTFLEDGLLLWVHLHHSIADGTCLGSLIVALAAETRGVSGSSSLQMSPFQPATLTRSIAPDISWDDLLASCPEMGLFPEGTPFSSVGGPLPRPGCSTATGPCTSVIFVFKVALLKSIGEMIRVISPVDGPPSTFVVLAALTWAYVTRARYRHEVRADRATPEFATMALGVSWRERAFRDDVAGYFGNASAAPVVRVSRDLLLGLAGPSSAPGSVAAWLPAVAASIQQAIREVDEPFVATRTALMDKAVGEGRVLGHRSCPGCAADLGMNSWRHFGGDAEWGIPGVGVDKADRVRLVSRGAGCGGALVLPAKREAEELELLVTLTEGSMRELTACQEWTTMVDRVVGA